MIGPKNIKEINIINKILNIKPILIFLKNTAINIPMQNSKIIGFEKNGDFVLDPAKKSKIMHRMDSVDVMDLEAKINVAANTK
jgi:hypothetical protein